MVAFFSPPPFFKTSVATGLIMTSRGVTLGSASSARTIHSYTGVNIGPEYAGRYVLIIVHGGVGSALVNSAGINGVNTTQLYSGSVASGTVYVGGAFVPTGTSVNVVASFTASQQVSGFKIVSISGVATGGPTIVSHQIAADVSQSSKSVNLATVAGGVMIALASGATSSSSFSVSGQYSDFEGGSSIYGASTLLGGSAYTTGTSGLTLSVGATQRLEAMTIR